MAQARAIGTILIASSKGPVWDQALSQRHPQSHFRWPLSYKIRAKHNAQIPGHLYPSAEASLSVAFALDSLVSIFLGCHGRANGAPAGPSRDG